MLSYLETFNKIIENNKKAKENTYNGYPILRGYTPEYTIDNTSDETANEDTEEEYIPSGAKKYLDKDTFVAEMKQVYSKALKKAGIDQNYAILLTAQDALESGYGRKTVGSYNFGNITTRDSNKSSTEGDDTDGYGHKIRQNFRNYDSLQDYCDDKIALLKGKRYNAFNGDISDFFLRVKRGGYATDPQYVQKLISVYNSIS